MVGASWRLMGDQKLRDGFRKSWGGGDLRTFHKKSQACFGVESGPAIRQVYLLRETSFVRK